MSFIGPHHAYRRDLHTHKKSPSFRLITLVDKCIYGIGLIAVLANMPQLWNIWVVKNSAGVSLISWTGFLVGSLFWFCYGLLHKEKPIMVINAFLIVVQGGIVLGLLVHV